MSSAQSDLNIVALSNLSAVSNCEVMSVNYEGMDIDIQRTSRCDRPPTMQPTKANAKYYEGPEPKALDSVTQKYHKSHEYNKYEERERVVDEQAQMKEYHNSTW